jgi:hypothetical protein
MGAIAGGGKGAAIGGAVLRATSYLLTARK